MRPLTIVVLASLLVIARPQGSPAVDLQSHRAVYRMALSTATRGSDVVAADGTMFYRFARGCDGWTVENRTLLRLVYDNETEADTLWTFASWESTDGRRFRFHARYDQDGRTLERLEGEADRGDEAGGRARFAQPPDTEIALPAGTVFPTEHIRQLIGAAEGGQRTLNRVVFDGASIDNPYTVNALFGPLTQEQIDALARSTRLPAQPSWWTRMAFFPIDDVGGLPEFEMAAQYRADGIADNIVQQFENFALDVRLKDVELLPPPDC